MKRRDKALVLGGGGFIGLHLIEELSSEGTSEIEAAGLYLDSILEGPGLRKTEGSIDSRLLDACGEPGIVYFLAGGGSVPASMEDPRGDFYLGLPPLVDLMDKLRRQWRNTRLVYMSSSAVYGSRASSSTGVDTSLSPISPYGLHKKIAEECITYYAEKYGIDAYIVRAFSVYGPGLRKQLLWDAMNKAAKGDFTFWGTGEELRDWIQVEDLARFLAAYRDGEDPFPTVVNAGTGKGSTVREILTALLRSAGFPQAPAFTESGRSGDPNHLVARREEQCGFDRFFKTDIKAGLDDYARWFMEQKA